MRKALVIPKAVVAVICLIAAIVLAAPVMPMMTNRMFGGGTIDFNTEDTSEYSANRPINGKVYFAFSAVGGKDGNEQELYYYLVPVKGKQEDKDNPIDSVILVKAPVKSELYSQLNDIYRASAEGGSKSGCELSGVLSDPTSEEKAIAKKLFGSVPNQTITISDYVFDTSKSVSAMTGRFLLSLLCMAAAVFFAVLTAQAVKKNSDIERIEDERMVYRMEQERKSGNKNEDGSDKMFGDSDASYGVTPPKDGETAPTGGYNPSFQSQGGEEFAPRNDYSNASDEDGFLGGGGSFFGAAPQNAQPAAPSAAPVQNNDPFANSAFNEIGQSEDNGSFYGGSNNGGFYGAQGGTNYEEDDDAGFFVRR